MEGGTQNNYVYANDPLNSSDLSGTIIETIADAAGIGYDANEFRKHPSWGNAGMLTWSVGATMLPFVPGSWAGRAAAKASNYSRKLPDGRIREYEKFNSAKVKGEMAGAQKVREFNPNTGNKRVWLQTVDNKGKVRIVRPFDNKGYRHYTFSKKGKYNGRR